MKIVNFKEIEVTDISGKQAVKGDARKEFADLLYTTCNGIAAHSLAFKIYESTGAIEISEHEEGLICSVAEQKCTPAFIDGIRKQLMSE